MFGVRKAMFGGRKWMVAVACAAVAAIGTSAVAINHYYAPGTRLDADLSSRTLKVITNGKVVVTYGIAVGRPKYPTPTGSFQTGTIDYNPAWNPPDSPWARGKKPQAPGAPGNPLRGVKIYFRAPAYYIHGTNNPGSIGEAASHGCIRMTEEDAISLARRIEKAGGSVPLLIHH